LQDDDYHYSSFLLANQNIYDEKYNCISKISPGRYKVEKRTETLPAKKALTYQQNFW